jgi:mannose-1-phosphate guanylyltransferase
VTAAKQDTRVVILAGGSGSRFWPLSRTNMPKQFLSMGESSESLIQATARRMVPLVGEQSITVVANGGLKALVRQHVPFAELIIEPEARNTAACIGLAAVASLVGADDADPVLVILPADHAVSDEVILRKAIAQGVEAARSKDVLVTIGIPPTHPHTGYGYIKRGKRLTDRAYHVDRFYEKPSLERAEKYLEQGGYYWNSGMFVWRARVILEAFREHLPEMHAGLMQIAERFKRARAAMPDREVGEIFSKFESISIDFGVLEHARNCVVIDSEPFGWNDVGSWDQWAESFKADELGNLVRGDAVVIDSKGCVVRSAGRLIAAVGLKDVVIIDSGDALLVVAREHVQDVRKVVSELKEKGRTELV